MAKSVYMVDQEREAREQKKINQKIELQDLLILLELEIQKEYNKIKKTKKFNVINLLDNYNKIEIIKRTLEKYKQKYKFMIDTERYYKNYLYFKYDNIFNKIKLKDDKYKQNKPQCSNADIKAFLNDNSTYKTASIKKPVGGMTKMLTAIFARI